MSEARLSTAPGSGCSSLRYHSTQPLPRATGLTAWRRASQAAKPKPERCAEGAKGGCRTGFCSPATGGSQAPRHSSPGRLPRRPTAWTAASGSHCGGGAQRAAPTDGSQRGDGALEGGRRGDGALPSLGRHSSWSWRMQLSCSIMACGDARSKETPGVPRRT